MPSCFSGLLNYYLWVTAVITTSGRMPRFLNTHSVTTIQPLRALTSAVWWKMSRWELGQESLVFGSILSSSQMRQNLLMVWTGFVNCFEAAWKYLFPTISNIIRSSTSFQSGGRKWRIGEFHVLRQIVVSFAECTKWFSFPLACLCTQSNWCGSICRELEGNLCPFQGTYFYGFIPLSLVWLMKRAWTSFSLLYVHACLNFLKCVKVYLHNYRAKL